MGGDPMPPGPAGEPGKPRAGVRERVLADARSRRAGGGGSPPHDVQPRQPRRFFDPAGEVARLHIGAPGDAERTQEVDALAFGTPFEGDASPRFLAQVQRILGFSLAFVSVVRGERAGYHAQIGMAEGAGRSRRRETTFCTHTVSAEAPLIVPNAAVEPFFRGSSMVQREGVKAYVGVPLRTSRGVIIGTVCVMDFAPRYIGAAHVRVLDLFTEPIAAEIERLHRGVEGAWSRTARRCAASPGGVVPPAASCRNGSPRAGTRAGARRRGGPGRRGAGGPRPGSRAGRARVSRGEAPSGFSSSTSPEPTPSASPGSAPRWLRARRAHGWS